MSDQPDPVRASSPVGVTPLAAAREELRVSREQVHALQDRIASLTADAGAARAALERLSGVLPVVSVITDLDGRVRSANAAASRLLGAEPDALVGEALPALVEARDRPGVRTLLRALGAHPGPRTLTVGLKAPAPVSAQLTASAHRDDAGEDRVLWFGVVVPDEGAAGLPLHDEPVARAGTRSGDGLMDRALVATLTELARLATTEVPLHELLRVISRIAAHALPGVRHATVTTGDPREPVLLASDSAQAQRGDAAQMEAQEGPCVDAFRRNETVWSIDVAVDPRWPRLNVVAPRYDLRAVVGVPVPLRHAPVGVLNLYLDDALEATFVEELADRAATVAAAVGHVLSESDVARLLRDEAAQLRVALTSRAEIDQAKGIIMARFGCSSDEAFAHLVKVSRDNNVKLRDVARRLVRTTTDQGATPSPADGST